MTLATRDVRLIELMDDPACDPASLRRTVERFRIVNWLWAGWGGAYRAHVRPALAATDGPARILDIGCGGGDVLRRIVRLAREDGIAIEAVGIDPDDRVLEVAEAAGHDPAVSYRRAHTSELVAEGARFDVVTSNHVLHHLDDDGLRDLLADSEALTGRISVHSDIARGRVPYAAYAVGITPFAPGSFLRTDGLRSIRRSYTQTELAAALPPGWTVEHARPFRLLAIHQAQEDRS